jgi:hypothetical protein
MPCPNANSGTRRGCTFTIIDLVVILAILAILLTMLGQGGTWVAEVPLTLALGWMPYLARIVPGLNPDPWAVSTAILCLAGVAVGAHYFLRWLAGGAWPWKRTLRCVSLVVLMFVAGIALVGVAHQTAWLARSPESLTPGRYTGARMHSANNLKQIGIAVHSRHDHLTPPEVARSTFSATGAPMHSWQTALLPYIEQEALHKQIDLTKPWVHPANAGPLGERIPTFLNPAVREETVNGLGVSHYAGNAAVVLGEARTFKDFPAGISNTILAGEVASHFRAWGDPLNARDPRLGASGHDGFGGPRRAAQFVMLDGSVRTFEPKELAEFVGSVPE